MSAHVIRNSFNAGEISPLMDARVDSEKYAFGCRKLENFIPRIYGGAFRRPGTEYMGAVYDATKKVRLIPFNYSATTRFVIEMGHEYLRFWSNGSLVTLKPLFPATPKIDTPYDESEIFDVQFVQLNDVCYLTHPSHHPKKLVRVADDTWTFENVAWTWPCFADQNIANITAQCAVTTVGATGTLTFSEPVFANQGNGIPFGDWVGTHFQIAHRRASSSVQTNLTSTTTGTSIRILGEYSLTTYGTWGGTLELQRKLNDGSGNWETIRSWFSVSGNGKNIAFTGTQQYEGELRVKFTYTAHTGAPHAILEASDSIIYGIVKVTVYNGPSTATVEVVKALHSTDATPLWSMEAFCAARGYPRAVAFHEQRLIYGGTTAEPSTIWGSTIGDFQNFQRTGYDDSSFAFTLAAQEGSAIQAMVSHKDLVILTQSEEWRAFTSQDQVITPSNITVRRQSRFGSAYRQALVANQSVLFVQRGNRKVREFVYSSLEESSDAPDLTLLAEHITLGGIRQFAFQQQPDPVLWAVTEQGYLLSMTFERDQNVVGWSRHVTDGAFESVAVIYGEEGEADEVWTVVKRTINSATVRYIERLDPEVWVKLDDLTTYKNSLIFCDSAKVITQSSSTSVTGLSHLEGKAVSVLANGSVVTGLTVSSGGITLPSAATKVVVGLPYTSYLQPSKTEMQMQDGTAQGRKALARRLVLNLWKSAGVEYADDIDDSTWNAVETAGYDGEYALTESGLFTGEIPVLNTGKHRENVDIAIRAAQPLPANVRAIITKFDVHGN